MMPDFHEKSVLKKFRSRTIYRALSDPWIEVLHVSALSGRVETQLFRASAIDRLESAPEDRSVIVLRSGGMVSLALPYAALAEKIQDGLSPVDLKAHCTLAVDSPESGQKPAEDREWYIGQYAPRDRNGVSLGKIFNVYAAPEDLPETMKYVDAVKHIAGLKKWHGYDGTNYPTDKEIYAALKDGSYKGGWIIPTRELLVGTEPDGKDGVREGKVIQPDNLFDHQNKGAFKGTFKTAAASFSDFPDCYWSSTEGRDNPSHVWDVRFSDGKEAWHYKDCNRFSCRPVRLVEASVSGPRYSFLRRDYSSNR